MASRHDIIHIDFEANAGKVSPALKAIQNSAADTRKAVQEVEQELANLEKAGADSTAIEAKKKQLRDLNRDIKSLNQAEREYVKGIDTLSKAIKEFNEGTLSQMNAAFQKASYNAAKLAQTKLDPKKDDYKKSMDELNALMQRNLEYLAKARMQTDDLLKAIADGGKVSASWIRTEKQNLEELLDVIPRGTAEWKEYNDQLTKIKDYTQTLSETERRLAGEIVDANDARRMANQLTKEGAEAAAREREAAEATIAAQEKKIAGMEEERQERLKSAQALSKQVADEANEIELKKQAIAELEKQVAAEKAAAESTQKSTQATKQSSETTSEATKKLQEERAALNSMESAHEGNIKKLQEEQQAISKVDEAIQQEAQVMQEAEVKKAQNQELTVKRMEEIVAMLEKENHETIPANSKQWMENKAVIDDLTEKIKVAKGEWMSYAEASKLAGQVGTNDFIATQQQLQQAMASVQREIDRTKKSLQDLNAEENKDQATIDKGKAKLEQLEKQFKDLKFEQDNFNMSHERMQNLLKEPKSTRGLDELRAAIKRAEGELHRMQDSLGTNKEAAEAFAKQIKEAKIALGQLESQSKASASAFEKAWSRLKTYISLYVGAAVAMQKVAATMGDLMELSDKMGEVRKTTGWSADEVGRLSDNLKKLDVRTSLVQLLDLSAAAGQLGLKTQEAVEGFTKSANMLMVALPEMGREAATSLMKIADATGDLEKNGGNVEETLQRVGSTIIALRANSASAAPAITDFVSRVGAVGAQAGISIDQIAAMGSTIDALGGRVEMSATALSRMIPAIRNNSFAVANSIGVTESYLKSLSAMDQMVLIFQKLRDSIKGINTETEEGQQQMADNVEAVLGKNAVMAEVMKDLNQQGARAGIVFGLLSQNVDKLQEQLGIASDAYQKNIALQNEFNNMNETTAAKWARLKNEIEEAFVSDSMQRGLGWIIDRLRDIVDFIVEDGPIAKGLKVVMSYLIALKLGIGSTIVGAGGALKNLGIAVMALANNLGIFTRATASARTEWKKMDAAMKTNIWGAVIAAIGMVVYKIYDWIQATKEAAAEIGRFNEGLSKEKRALDDLFAPLEKGNLAQKERSRLITEINNKYGKYLGYMLSETTQATQLAEAHRSVALAIQEEALQKRILDQEGKVREKHAEDLNAAYGGIESAVRGAAKGEVNVQDITDSLKGFIDSSMGRILEANATRAFSSTAVGKELDKRIERLVVDGKLSRDAATDVYRAVADYAKEARSQTQEMQQATANSRADLRNTEREMVGTVNANINTLVSNLSNFGRRPQGTQTTQGKGVLAKPEQQGLTAPQWGVQHNWQGDYGTKPNFQEPAEGWKPNIDKKNIEQVKRYVEAQDQLRGYLEANAGHIDEQTRKTAEMYLESEEEMKKLRGLLPKESGGAAVGGGGGTSPYGNFDRVASPYGKWDADSLVNRRKEMLERVRSLANGADVQKVLSEDAKFISEAVRNNIKTTEQAIEWYNKERLKIQDALHEKHLTNTGDWMDPKKSGKKASKQVQGEMKYYLDELDAYYTERKAMIQEQRNDEQISESEAWRRTLQNDAEWQQRRAELQKLYAERSAEVTQEEMDAIFDILSERTGDTVKSIQKDIEHTVKFIKKVGEQKGVEAMKKILGDLDLGIEQAFLRQRNAVGKQMDAIADIIEKERPFNGITKNLEDNLTKMGVLQADFEKQRLALLAKREDTTALDKKYRDEIPKRLTFMLTEAERAYNTNITEVMARMAGAGMKALADEIKANPQMQEALMAQLRNTFDKIQEAVKKEASLWKKEAETMWNNILVPDGDGKTTLKQAADKAVAQLSLNEGRVTRANNLIGAGQASERVADKLAIQQMKIQLAMEDHYYALLRKRGEATIKNLREQAQLARDRHEYEKATRLELDAQHAEMALNVATSKEELELAKKREQIEARIEETQNRLYKEIKSWVDLISSGLKDVFEASNTGNAEYYNERARLELEGTAVTGVSTDNPNEIRPGSNTGGVQQYMIIENAGTEDAEAHYEYLTELEYLEKKREIEQENAQKEAWKKLLDEINMKFNDTITDALNAMFQDNITEANTDAVIKNTEAILKSTEVITGRSDTSTSPVTPSSITTSETTIIQNSTGPSDGGGKTPTVEIGTLIPEGIIPDSTVETGGSVSGGGGSTGGTVSGGGGIATSMFPMTREELTQAQTNIELLWQTYVEKGAEAMIDLAEQLANIPNAILPPWQMPEGGVEGAVQRIQELWAAYKESGIEALQEMSDAMAEMDPLPPDITHMSEDNVESAIENASALATGQAQVKMDASKEATQSIIEDQQEQANGQAKSNTQMQKSNQSMWAKMTQAMNLYGVAYQAMANDNLSTEQKFETIALQAAGNAAMAGLQVVTSRMTANTSANMAESASKSTAENGPILGPILFAVCSALIGGLMGLAMSKLTKAKSDISAVTGASSSASVGKLTTGMLTYAEGNVNEFTSPSSLTPGRSYNVDAADGKTYRAKYTGKNPSTHITNGPEFHLAGEKGREMIIDAGTTHEIVYNEPAVMKAIKMLSGGGRIRHLSAMRRGRGMAAFADGNIEDFEAMANEQAAVAGNTSVNLAALQSSIDRQSELLDRALTEGIKAHFDVYGKGGLIDSYDQGKKFVSDRNWPY